jgi:putative mRNA 3-end processing factor
MKVPFQVKAKGLFVPPGDFYIDAQQSVPVSIITHAHGDHARPGHGKYICTPLTAELLKYRLGKNNYQTVDFGKKFKLKNCWVSFHPAGHILGSAQVRIETEDSVCVISGDYKRHSDPTCEPFEVVKCDTFITESTFALPIYHWESSEVTAKKIYDWWQENRKHGFCSVLYGYVMGKAQRILGMLAALTDEPIYTHGAIYHLATIYEQSGIPLSKFSEISENKNSDFSKDLVLAPPLAKGSPWLKRFYPYKSAFASGWMQVRGMRKQRNVDRGFVLSDHADWTELLDTIHETGASKIFTTHGNASTLALYLKEQGKKAFPLHGMEDIKEGEGD